MAVWKPKHTPQVLREILSSTQHLGLLLGAGASRCQGYPLMDELTEDALTKLPRRSTRILQYVVDHAFANTYFNVEHMLGVLFTYEHIGDFSEDELNDTILRLKAHIFSCVSAPPATDDHKRFFGALLAKVRNAGPIEVFTTNYDLAIERALDRLGVSYTTGFTGSFSRNWSERLFRTVLVGPNEMADSSRRVVPCLYCKVVKLHGSISWYWDDQRFLHERDSVQPPIFDLARVPIVYPTPQKRAETQWISPFREMFAYFVDSASTRPLDLVVIGYSFRDDHLNELLHEAMACNRELHVLVFARDEEEVPSEVRTSKRHGAIVGSPGYEFERVAQVLEDIEVERDTEVVTWRTTRAEDVAALIPDRYTWDPLDGLRNRATVAPNLRL